MSLVTAVLTPTACTVVSDGRITNTDGTIYYEEFKKFRVFNDRLIVLGGGYQQPLVDFWRDIEGTSSELTWVLVDRYLRAYMTKKRWFVLGNHTNRDDATSTTIILCGLNDAGQISAHAYTNDGYGMYDKEFTAPAAGQVVAIACPPSEFPSAREILVQNVTVSAPDDYVAAQIKTQLQVATRAHSVNAKSFCVQLDVATGVHEFEQGTESR